ncbi:MAG: hypothetical protein K1X36_05000 [Pyrinomonadaceae bacterium]|nr:hypothetical protein [Pyrinomonadaceae bacterium]
MFARSSETLRITLLAAVALLTLLAFSTAAAAQDLVDKTVATVSDGTRSELITYSDIMWQLALEPGVQIDPPKRDDLNSALLRLIDQRLFALEANRLPRPMPTEEAIRAEIDKIVKFFPSAAAFEARLKTVGFESISDDNFQRLISQRLSIEDYIDFRFRSFTVVTPEDESRYFRDVLAPDFRKRFPGLLMPTLDEKRRDINRLLTEDRVASRLESFLDDAKRRAEIDIISEP